jgi:hypothetical protein
MSDSQVPEGYMQDHLGRLVPETIVKDVDKMRDTIVKEIVHEATQLSEALTAFKRKATNDVLAFVALSVEKYGVKLGGTKGNISLTSFDGTYKVQRSINEYITFDERLEAAKALIDECLKSWTSESSDEMRELVNFAFKVDKTGNISIQRIMGLLRVNIKDETWKKAMEAITESIQISGSKAYIRIYKRIGDSDKYKQINLDMAAV